MGISWETKNQREKLGFGGGVAILIFAGMVLGRLDSKKTKVENTNVKTGTAY